MSDPDGFVLGALAAWASVSLAMASSRVGRIANALERLAALAERGRR